MPTTKEEKEAGWLSVTEVLDTFIPKGLLNWYLKTGAKEAKRLSTVAMKIGTRVDELIQQDIKDGSCNMTKKDSIEVQNCISAWHKFKSDYSPNVKASQLEVVSQEEMLKGHIDLIIDNTVVDIKCASSIKPNYWLQVAKYDDMRDDYPANLAILRLDKSLATYQFVTNKQSNIDPEHCVRVFDGLLEAYRYYHPKDEKEDV